MTYEVTISILDKITYKGLFSLKNKKIYIRSLIDEDNYEEMFKELIQEGYVEVKRNGIDLNVKVIEFENNLLTIFETLKSDGFDIKYHKIEEDACLFQLLDLDNIIQNTKEAIKKNYNHPETKAMEFMLEQDKMQRAELIKEQNTFSYNFICWQQRTDTRTVANPLRRFPPLVY